MLRSTTIPAVLLLALAAGCGADTVPADPPGTGTDAGTGGTDGGSGGTGGATGGTGGATGGTGGATGGTGGATGGTGGDVDSGPGDACEGIDALRPTCQALPDEFESSTTLAKGCYLASTTPVLGAGVTLTLSPGVTIIFAEDTGLTFDADQALVAAGTAEEPICLTGDVAERGSWRGLLLGRTEGDDDKLDYVTIEYAGGTESDADAAAIKTVSDSRAVDVSITNTTVRESAGYGLYLIASVEAVAFSGNTFTKNMRAPVSVDSDVAGVLDAASDYTGNDVDEIAVRSAYLTKDTTWRSVGVPYHLSGNLAVSASLTIDAPNTLVMGEEAWLSTTGDSAALHAVGTASDPIVFTGEQKERGYWDGLVFEGTNNAGNRLEYVTVEYAGCTLHDASGAGVKAIADSHGVTLSLTHTTIQESEGFGLYLSGSAVTPEFSNNTFTKNSLGPASVGSEAVSQLDTTTTYTGNDLDHLHVRTNHIPNAATWQDIGVPYELDGNLQVDLVWTLAPGVTLLMAQDSWISIDGDDAGFHAVGTAQKPITISGIEQTSGYWHSIRFGTTLNGANALEHTIVEYGGSTGGGGEQGMINATADSHGVALTVSSSTIRHSGQYGIWLGGSAQYNSDIESSNTFAGNAAGDVFFQQ